jgi:hypothetical protein
MKAPINVSRGQRITFAADGQSISGIILGSEQTPGAWASVAVETESAVPTNSHLSLPDLPETGGCGAAHPQTLNGKIVVILSIGYSYVDISTVGK